MFSIPPSEVCVTSVRCIDECFLACILHVLAREGEYFDTKN